MSNYDPRRSRPRPVVDPDPEAAPIEALFGPEPDPVPADSASNTPSDDPSASSDPASSDPASSDPADNGKAPSITAEPRRPVPTPKSSAPSPIWQLAPLVAGLSLLAALVWWLTRRRNPPSA